jgi:hypothetical protein
MPKTLLKLQYRRCHHLQKYNLNIVFKIGVLHLKGLLKGFQGSIGFEVG